MDRKVAIRLKLHNVRPENIHCVLILHELLVGSKLVQGYVKVDDSHSAWHLWVEHDNKILDVNKKLYELWNNKEEGEWKYSKDIIGDLVDGYEDSETTLDEYQTNHDLFWRRVPTKIKRARQKVLNNLKIE